MISDLDLNRDGQISCEEFITWWLSGRRGSIGTLSQILSAKLGGKNFFDTLDLGIQELAKGALKGQYETNNSSVEFNLNGGLIDTTKGSRAWIKMMMLSDEVTTKFKEIKAICIGDGSSEFWKKQRRQPAELNIFAHFAVKMKPEFKGRSSIV